MMSLKDAVNKGNERYQGGLTRNRTKLTLRPLSATGLLSYFNLRFREADFGEPPMVSAKDVQMLRGVLRLIKNNEKEDDWTYSLISDMIERWDDLRRLDHTTMKGTLWNLGPRPSITDFVICHKAMIANIESLRSQSLLEERAVNSMITSSEGPAKPKKVFREKKRAKFNSSEFDLEMERSYQDE